MSKKEDPPVSEEDCKAFVKENWLLYASTAWRSYMRNGRGALVVDYAHLALWLSGKAFTYTPAYVTDSSILLQWRNDPETRRNFIHQELVEEEEHQEWLTDVLRNPLRRLYIAEVKEMGYYEVYRIPFGTIRADYDKEDDTWELSWTISPAHRRKGFGVAMVSVVVHLFDWTVKAQIKADNVASSVIAIRAGMEQYDLIDGIQYWRR